MRLLRLLLIFLLAVCFVPSWALAQPVPVTQCVSTAIAGGTADAITIPQLPCVPTTTTLILTITQDNTTTTPTITPAQGITQTIVQYTGAALTSGFLHAGARYILSNSGHNWILLTPAVPTNINLTATGLGQALTVTDIMSGVNNVFLGPPLFASGQVLGDFAGNYIQATNRGLATYDVPLGAAFVTPFWADFTVAGPTVTGNQTTTLFTMSVNQPGKPHQNQSGGQRWYSALYTDTWMYTNDGGTPSAALGNLQGGVFTVNALSGTTYINDIEGIEVNAGCYAGCSTLFKEGVVITGIIGDAVHASELEGLLVLSTQNVGFGWNVGILLTDIHGGTPLSTGGCVMCAIFHGGPYTIGNGIDLSAYTITGNLLASRNFQVAGSGLVTIATLDPTIEMHDTSVSVTAGGLIRLTCSSGNCAWQQNTAVAGDFSTVTTPFGWTNAGNANIQENLFVNGILQVKAATPSLEMLDTAQPITTGGLIRLTGNAGGWAFQINTAAGGDFTGPVKTPFEWDVNGTAYFPQIVASPGGKNMLCIDSATKAIYQGTTTTC